MRNKEVKLVVEKFKYHYKAITNDESFRLNMTENRLTMTLNFIKEMKNFTNSPLLGEDYVKSFMEFQFNYWFEHEGKYGRGTSVQLEWIIGKKALKRWFERSEKFKRATNKIVRKNLKKKVKFKLDGVRNEGWGKTMLELREVDEVLRRIKTLRDVDKVITQITTDGKISTEQKEKLVYDIRVMLSNPNLQEVFSDTNKVFNEKEIGANGKHFRVDKLSLTPSGKIYLLDFKTGEEISAHKKQIEEYKNVLHTLNFTDVEPLIYYTQTTKLLTY
jgi:hypothetical protein